MEWEMAEKESGVGSEKKGIFESYNGQLGW